VEDTASALEYTLIASADSPVGDAVVKRLSASRPLVLNGTQEGWLHELLAQCRPGAHLWLHDLQDVQDISASLGRLLRDSNIAIRALVHCGGANAASPADPPDERAFAGPVFSGIELVRTLRRREPNRSALAGVVFASSYSTRRPLAAAAQGAIEAFTRSAAVELAGKCRLNCVVAAGADAASGDTVPNDTAGPEAMAAAVEFLLSDGACGITGQRLAVDAVK
jgi:NAD(P)-dependent dehydrogenase (short-subunit alcohol dehydrogenase family)